MAPDQYHGMAYPAFAIWQGTFEPTWWTRVFWDVTLDLPVGFVQIALDGDAPGEHFLERIAIDERYQGSGYGKLCLQLVLDAVQNELPGLRKGIKLSYSAPTADYCPASFYLKLGFRHLGTIDDDQVDMYYAFDPSDHKSPEDTPCPFQPTQEHMEFVPEEDRFANIPGFPHDIQPDDVILSDDTKILNRVFYFGNSLGPMVSAWYSINRN
ncbi:hypothetical protein BCR33DRAFT_577565 [Rhizoclosmatium globosum]|uniref:N-acetyltransferase domain-containing protein n=1 Tax=Rhizoclosmatium globosum TaxID=329046 RepID=A0A1Y2B3R8_9FUNG|nr:hypothetical protein BCR33DRAFT_577565 [Rhizoclosmatium globosum]|eukprot:ORY29473.1 hypothetical protein BCR33DRAFT_577565 [Rhizoclosmatium globosum]